MGIRNNYELAKTLNIEEGELNYALPCKCGGFYTLRLNRKNLSQFFGCSRYPRCKTTRRYADVDDELVGVFLSRFPDISNMEPW